MQVEIRPFGHGYDEIILYNNEAMISFSNLGARINRWKVGGIDLVLGSASAEQVMSEDFRYFGATIGRVAGRIKGAQIELSGRTYPLDANEGTNTLHGGRSSYDLASWDYTVHPIASGVEVCFTYVDPDGANGFPGEVKVEVTHRYESNHRWTVSYRAEASQETVFAPTNHAYFNLSGKNRTDLFKHRLYVPANDYLPLDEAGLPLGKQEAVEGTAFDLRDGPYLGDVIQAKDTQIQNKKGLDHPFSLQAEKEIRLSYGGRELSCQTDQPFVVLYSLNHVEEGLNVWGEPLHAYHGLAIETQVVPDAIHLGEAYGKMCLQAGEVYRSQTSYQYHVSEKG